ncbi:MAG TPA: hypothetical protein VLD57_12095, partial [Blastocatellia bacterium]|nr:hypothetical protein [Blastocatellia bacterium]
DLEKMLAKLSRERDRHWFIEVRTESHQTALIHLADQRCQVITEDGVAGDRGDAQGFAGNVTLSRLLEECKRAGAHFDVLFKRAAAKVPADLITNPEPAEQEISIKENIIAASVEESTGEDLPAVPPDFDRAQADEPQSSEPGLYAPAEEYYSEAESYEEADLADEPEPLHQEAGAAIGPNTRKLFAQTSISDENTGPASEQEAEVATEAGESPSLREGEAMIEIKRLMGEITRTIEEAARAAEPQSKFPMYLRAGQLKLADRYPFLDPFGAEFEYLDGEIAFIGRAAPSVFIAGLTEALKLAVAGVVQSSAQPARVRKQMSEELDRLRSRIGPELERHHLDETIDVLIQSV